jgi:hypothetical protein
VVLLCYSSTPTTATDTTGSNELHYGISQCIQVGTLRITTLICLAQVHLSTCTAIWSRLVCVVLLHSAYRPLNACCYSVMVLLRQSHLNTCRSVVSAGTTIHIIFAADNNRATMQAKESTSNTTAIIQACGQSVHVSVLLVYCV